MTRLNQDVLSGLLFVLIGCGGLYVGWDYATGTAFRMGPGYFPRLLCALLIGLGAVVALKGLIRGGDAPERMQFRPLIMITLAVIAFALLISTAGLLPAAVAVVLLGCIGGPEFRVHEAIILAIVLTAGAIGLFKYGLAMSFPIFAFPIPFL